VSRFRPTLAQAFVAANVFLAALLAALVYGLYRGSERSVLATAELAQRGASRLIEERIQTYVDGAERTAASVEARVRLGLSDPRDPASVEAALFGAALDHPDLAAVSLTAGRALGWDAEGRIRLAPEGRWQVTVYREEADAGELLQTAWVRPEGPGFVRDVGRRVGGQGLREATLARAVARAVPDPTTHPTFVTPASRSFHDSGRTLWSDLSFIEADAHLPEAERRVVVTALRTLRDRAGAFAGVLRLALRTETLDRIVAEEEARARPSRIALCDEAGRLVARAGEGDRLVEQPDASLRHVPSRLPGELARALADPALRGVTDARPETATRFELDGRPFLASFRALPQTQGWRVAVVVAQDALPGLAEQDRMRRRLLAFASVVSGAILAGGILAVRGLRQSLGRVGASSRRMREFDFQPARTDAFFRDAQDVLEGLELAKTAMRAMSKYVPVGLVRLLYLSGREPELGGEPMTVSLLFSDVKGFTGLSERLPPNELARVLGRYFEVMTAAIQGCGGTIDKYIGDAIMAVWNAPTPVADHARRACEAALAMQAAGEALFRSAEWEGRPPLVTRIGLHTDEVLVGHFGAPDRLSYTCLGDGVNLAARLEGLNKQYGTTLLVSDAVRRAAGPGLAFRFLDVVAVSGKAKAVRVHELIGPEDAADPRQQQARRYEDALALYLRRDFVAARAAFEALAPDPPSAVLAERCRRLAGSPPGEGWDGVYVATSK
jgi:adenylate cyclase